MEAKWGKPFMSRNEKDGNIDTQHSSLGAFKFSFVDPKPVELIFAENETNAPKLFGTPRQEGQRFKDGFHSYIVGNDRSAVSHEGGTKGTQRFCCCCHVFVDSLVFVQEPGCFGFKSIMESLHPLCFAFTRMEALLWRRPRRVSRSAEQSMLSTTLQSCQSSVV
jgi:hypothetical protein